MDSNTRLVTSYFWKTSYLLPGVLFLECLRCSGVEDGIVRVRPVRGRELGGRGSPFGGLPGATLVGATATEPLAEHGRGLLLWKGQYDHELVNTNACCLHRT